MESFNQCAIQMLREFRNLLRHSPIAIASHRLLQLMALNMFAVDCTQLKGESFITFLNTFLNTVKICIEVFFKQKNCLSEIAKRLKCKFVCFCVDHPPSMF